MIDRRNFLKFSLATALLASCDAWRTREKIGLALGGGGARGLAHILMLEVFDELGIRPHRLAGTSIGAVMGTLYAAGMSAREIRELVDRLTVSDDESWLSGLFEQDIGRWWEGKEGCDRYQIVTSAGAFLCEVRAGQTYLAGVYD